MNTRLTSCLLAASTVVSSYLVLLIGYVLPRLFAVAYRTQAPSDLAVLMPPITQFALRFAWAFALALVLVCAVTLTRLRNTPSWHLQFLAIGHSVQALVVWLAMFCYCYDGFHGPISLHHAPRFDFGEFFQFGFGVFPVTLFAILLPGFFALLCPND